MTQVRGVLGLTPGSCQPFRFPLLSPHSIYMSSNKQLDRDLETRLTKIKTTDQQTVLTVDHTLTVVAVVLTYGSDLQALIILFSLHSLFYVPYVL